MNGYLVLLVHLYDDIPVAFFASREDALERANMIDPMPTPYIRKLFNTDASTPACVKIVRFDGGLPVEVKTVRELG